MKFILVLAVLIVGFFYYSNESNSIEVNKNATVLVTQAPVQTPLLSAMPFRFKGFIIRPLAKFDMSARVLRREQYSVGTESSIAPVDIVFGWQHMSNYAVIEKIDITQRNRFYHWYTQNPPIPLQTIALQSANMHLIPANDDIKDIIKDIPIGGVAHLSGYLVRVEKDNGWHWQSSLSRSDIGAGACELIFVKSFARTL